MESGLKILLFIPAFFLATWAALMIASMVMGQVFAISEWAHQFHSIKVLVWIVVKIVCIGGLIYDAAVITGIHYGPLPGDDSFVKIVWVFILIGGALVPFPKRKSKNVEAEEE